MKNFHLIFHCSLPNAMQLRQNSTPQQTGTTLLHPRLSFHFRQVLGNGPAVFQMSRAAHSPPKGETRHKFSLSNKKIVKAQNQYPNSKSGLNAPILMSDLCYKLLQAYFGGKFRSVVTSITTLCLYYSIVLSKLMRLFRA